jgi:ubiquinone/menaquinone biosynthesis C-methylase UbiE
VHCRLVAQVAAGGGTAPAAELRSLSRAARGVPLISRPVVRREQMARHRNSQSPKPEAVAEHYTSGYEAGRLHTGEEKLDRERSRELLKRFLPPAPATILDVGGGPGDHACWLAKQGYAVHLIDITLVHVQLAKEASRCQPEAPLASANVGDACALSWKAEAVDTVLLFGPLYHLTDKADRLQALQEAYRVLKAGGVLLVIGISRFTSTSDGLRHGFLKDPRFTEIVKEDLKNGQHKNPTGKPEYFMETFFHHPDELRNEVAEVGDAGASTKYNGDKGIGIHG